MTEEGIETEVVDTQTQTLYDRLDELKEIRRQKKQFEQYLFWEQREKELLEQIEQDMPKEKDSKIQHSGLVAFWDMGKRGIGKDAKVDELEQINTRLVRVIPEKVTPAKKVPQTLTNIEKWLDMEYPDNPEFKQKILSLLDIRQSQTLKVTGGE